MNKIFNSKYTDELPRALEKFGGILGCNCNDCNFQITSSDTFTCSICGRSLKLFDAVLADSLVSEVKNSLEEIDYDALHGVSVEASIHLGKRWFELINSKLPERNDLDILELGAGTGFLTLGLALNGSFRSMIVSDLSKKFLRMTQKTITEQAQLFHKENILSKLCFLSCSIDELPIRSNSLDVVVANSVLHHIYDYERALIKIRRILRPGGIAIFSEPIIEGKAFVGFMAELLRDLDERAEQHVFTETERFALADLATLCTSGFWKKTAQIKKDTADDKHMFCIKDFRQLAFDIGWPEVDAVPYDPIEDGLLGILEDSLRIMNIRIEPLQAFSYIFKAFQKQIINEIPNQVLTPHAFLILRK